MESQRRVLSAACPPLLDALFGIARANKVLTFLISDLTFFVVASDLGRLRI